MSPVEQAKRLLGASFLDDLEAHLLHGCVFSSPDLFVMARMVPHGADVLDAWEQWPREQCSAFFVWMAVGDPLAILNLMPVPMPWVGWVRIGREQREIHWYETDRLRERLSRNMVPRYPMKDIIDGRGGRAESFGQILNPYDATAVR